MTWKTAMSDLNLPDNITARIQAIAEQEHRSVEESVARMLQYYPVQPEVQKPDETPMPDPLLGLIGLLDEEAQEADLSDIVR